MRRCASPRSCMGRPRVRREFSLTPEQGPVRAMGSGGAVAGPVYGTARRGYSASGRTP